MFHANYFRVAAIDSLGDTAIAATLTAARWGVLGWEWYTDAFFSPAASRRYRLVGEILGHCMILALLGYRMAQQWAASEVDGALPKSKAWWADLSPSDMARFSAFTESVFSQDDDEDSDPFCPTVNPILSGPTLAELRRQCIAHNKALPAGHPRRIARAARLTKSEALAALAGV